MRIGVSVRQGTVEYFAHLEDGRYLAGIGGRAREQIAAAIVFPEVAKWAMEQMEAMRQALCEGYLVTLEVNVDRVSPYAVRWLAGDRVAYFDTLDEVRELVAGCHPARSRAI
jgi:hypothetical protein